jgi:hypothetical protein
MNSSTSHGKIEDRKYRRMKRGLKVLGIDSTFILWKSKVSRAIVLRTNGSAGERDKAKKR